MQKQTLQLFAILTAIVCLTLAVGGIYLASIDKIAFTDFSLFGTDFSSTSVGLAMSFLGVVLFVTVFRSLIKSIVRLGNAGGTGGNAEVEGDGEAYGGRGGNSGSFGPGGKGGDARVKGSGKAKGGAGGNG